MVSLGVGRRIELAVFLVVLDFLEVERVDQRAELPDGLLQIVVDEAIREEHGVVRRLDLRNRQLDSLLELFLGLDTVADSLAQVLKARRIHKQKVSLNSVLVDLQRALDVDFNNRDLAGEADSVKLLLARAVAVACDLLPLDELARGNFLLRQKYDKLIRTETVKDAYLVEFSLGNVIIVGALLGRRLLLRSRRVTDLLFEDFILVEHRVEKGGLADA